MKVFDRAYQFYNGLPAIGKAIVIIGGGAAAWFGVINPVRKVIIKKLDEQKSQKTVNETKQDLNEVARKGIRPSYSDSQYAGWADKLQKQFDGCDFDWTTLGLGLVISVVLSQTAIKMSNSAKTVYAICYQFKNDADFLSLVKAWGVRTYDNCGLFTGDFSGNIYGAVSDELNLEEIKEINSLLAKKGITYKF